jgi:hypothetical protein
MLVTDKQRLPRRRTSCLLKQYKPRHLIPRRYFLLLASTIWESGTFPSTLRKRRQQVKLPQIPLLYPNHRVASGPSCIFTFLVWHWRLANSCNRHHGEHKIAEVPVGPSVIDRDFKNSSNDFRCSSCHTYPPTKFYSVPFANSVTCSSSHPEVIWSSQGHLVFGNTVMAYKIRTSPIFQTLPESSKKTETENKYVRQTIFDSYLKCVLVDNKVADSDEDDGLHCKEMT